MKGIATYGPYVVYPYDTCIGPLGCWGGIEYAKSLYAESAHHRRSDELNYALQTMALYKDNKGWVTDSVQALIMISNYVAQQTNSASDYMNDMALLILGYEHTAGTVLPMFDRGAGLPFNSTGFGEHFRDPSIANNQVNHFWFFVHAGYQFGHFEEGDAMVRWFAQLHEMEGIPLIGAAGGGGSIQDYQLSLFGIYMGKLLRNGAVKPDEMGTWLNAYLTDIDPFEEYTIR